MHNWKTPKSNLSQQRSTQYFTQHAAQHATQHAIQQRSPHGASLLRRKADISVAKPLLRILGRNERPGDVMGKRWAAAFPGSGDVYISRAELELRKAMELLVFDGAMGNSSLPILTALSLPGHTAPLLWTTYAFLQERYPKLTDASRIHHRNRDARMLYRQLAQLELTDWANYLLDQVHTDELPDGIYMPPGHPMAGETYRCHPFSGRRNFYYPVNQYFSMLFEEREQALVSLLSELGATKIVISAPPGDAIGDFMGELGRLPQLYEKIFEYPFSTRPLSESFDVRRHPWLSCEPEWQAVVKERVTRGALSAQFEFGMDIAGMLRTQVQTIARLISMLSSMEIPADRQAVLLVQLLQLRRVRVEFSR
jgi:hypothetical protein